MYAVVPGVWQIERIFVWEWRKKSLAELLLP